LIKKTVTKETTNVILIRHGQTDWTKLNRIQGNLDIPLNHEGQKEAEKFAKELSRFDIKAIYSSSASCSYATAQEVAGNRELKVKKMPEFNALNQSVWQGLLLKDVKKRYKKQYNLWHISPDSGKPPRGESICEACDRAVSAFHKVVDKHKNENICIVSHDIIFSILKCYINNVPLEKVWNHMPKKARWEIFEITNSILP